MTYFQAVILGLVQGLAEFLPVSSSGHLALLQNWFGIEEDSILLFSIALHFGTLIAVFIVYWKDIWALIKELFATIRDLCTGKGLHLESNPTRKFGMMIIVACIPTAVIGFLFEDLFSSMYTNLLWVCSGWIITGILLWTSDKKHGRNEIEKMNFRNAIFIGCIQGIAIWPGISRSGSTLFGSLFVNLKREFAVEFVFILSIPAILGSAILEFPDAVRQGIDTSAIGPVFVGMIVALISGIFAIKFMIRLVSNAKLKDFSIYVWILSVIVGIVTIISLV